MDVFRIRDFEIRNRLFVGTGKYATYELMQQALDASGCQVVTVAVRRDRLEDKQGRRLTDFLDLGDGADGSTLVLDRPVPIWIAALGPRALALAGTLADGVLLNWCTPARVTEAKHIVVDAALAAGRDPSAITVAAA